MTPEELAEVSKVRALARSGSARAIRLAAGITLGEVAASVGCSHSAVFRWEAGERKPMGRRALRYAAVLDALLSRRAR